MEPDSTGKKGSGASPVGFITQLPNNPPACRRLVFARPVPTNEGSGLGVRNQ